MLLLDPLTLLPALVAALVLDALTGDPAWLWRRLPHPVVLIGRAIARLEARWLDPAAPAAILRGRGALASLAVVSAAFFAGWLLQGLVARLPLGWLWLGIAMSSLIAGRGLVEHVAAVARGLEQGLAAARRAVAQIVGRDPESLDAPAIARAAIESTAENFADGVVAPVFWALVLGPPGMLAYKAINTLDSMIGHRSPRYRDFGRFAARLDDVVNWPAARLAGLVILAAAALLRGHDPGAGWRAMWRDAPHHRSPNAGWPEAAMAGALGLRLAGPRRYAGEVVEDAWMGDGRAEATAADIQKALRLMVAASALLGIALSVLLLAATV